MIGKRGLKIRISVTLLCLLAIGMLLVNLVVTAFWQKDLFKTQIETEKRNLRIWGELIQTQTTISSTKLQEIYRLGKWHFINVAYYDGQSLSYALDSDRDIGNLVLTAASGKDDVVHPYAWKFDIFSRYDCVRIAVFLPRGKAIGADIRMHSVSPLRGDEQQYILIYVLVNAIILSVIGLLRMLDLVFRPIDRLVEMTETYNVDEANFLFPVKIQNEFGILASSLNSMLRKIEADKNKLCVLVSNLEDANQQLASTQKEMIIAEKMAAVGLLSAGIAHEIGNPLSIIQGYIELLADRDLSENEAKQFSERAIYEISRVDALIRQLLNYARANPKDIVPASVKTILSEVIDDVKVNSNSRGINFVTDIQLNREIIVRDSSGLRQVIINCILNAIDAINDRDGYHEGVIEVYCAEKNERSIKIRIRDNGVGMTETQLLSAFDPFFTTKSKVRGTGLGLFVSYAIIKAIKGNMWLDSSPGKGTMVHLELNISE